jgi:hypothetical protein
MTSSEMIDSAIAAAHDYKPAEDPTVSQEDPRPYVMLPGQGRLLSDFAADLAKKLRDKPIYNRGGVVMVLDDSRKRLEPITATAFRSMVEDYVICQRMVGQGERAHLENQTLSEEGARGVLASRRFLAGLREVRRVNNVTQPVIREGSFVELLPVGYDEASRIFTFDSVDFDKEMKLSTAQEILEKWLKDFAFPKHDLQRSKSTMLAMMLATFCDCMFPDMVQRPAFIFAANTEGAGKTLGARMAICPVFGPMQITPPPESENKDKLMELLNSVAQAGVGYVVLDNWHGKIQNSALEAFITANIWAGRILGTSQTFQVAKQCLVFVTANDAIVSGDMRRRSLFVELFVEEARAEDRKIAKRIDEQDILENRGEILAALWGLVRNWVEKGMPESSIVHGTFPKWGNVIGGILESADYVSPLTTPQLLRGGDSQLENFVKVANAVLEEATTVEVYVKPGELLETARRAGAYPWFIQDVENPYELSEKERRSERTAFFRQCERFRGRTLPNGVKFDAIGEGHARQYKFAKPQAEQSAEEPF